MDALPFGEEELDMIWVKVLSITLLERGLKEWRKYSKPRVYCRL